MFETFRVQGFSILSNTLNTGGVYCLSVNTCNQQVNLPAAFFGFYIIYFRENYGSDCVDALQFLRECLLNFGLSEETKLQSQTFLRNILNLSK